MNQLYLPIEEAAANQDPQQWSRSVEKAEQQRQEILERFPRGAWPEMELEDYALGTQQSQDSYCWWLEWGSRELGSISGGSAAKHIIYKHKSGDWRYHPKEAYADVQEAWRAVRAGFVQAFELAEQGRWEGVDSLEALVRGPAIRTKTLHVYFPQDMVPIYSRDHLQHFLRLLNRPEGEENTYDVVRLNRALLEEIRRRDLPDWTNVQWMKFFYEWADPREVRKIVKIAPGDNARYWEDCRANGYICVGWDEVGDLSGYDNKAEFKQAFVDRYDNYNASKAAQKANELWTLRELTPGDLVVANEGISKVLAVGEVVEPGYQWEPNRPEYKHTVAVEWDTSVAGSIPTQPHWAFVTVKTVTPELYAEIVGGGPGTKPQLVAPPLFARIGASLQHKKQVVLYGPPGTGKTYTANRFAVWWLLRQRNDPEALHILTDEDALRDAERRLSASSIGGRAWWVVANPAQWSWDELFEHGSVDYRYGRLQKNYPLLQEGDLVIGYQASPDKRVVALAKVSEPLHTDDKGAKVFTLEPVARVSNGLTWDEMQEDQGLSTSEPVRFRNQGTLFSLTEDETERVFTRLLEQDPELEPHLTESPEVGPLTRLTFHPSYSYEDFIEGFRPVDKAEGLVLRLVDGIFKRVCHAAVADPDQPYVMLIDEINRANLPKVFGELITLLESDKRGLTVVLPQSREPFQIPPNVFLLSTMNTADRSIRLLDAAIRRRFAFIELMPDIELFRGAQIGELRLDEFLHELNRRIIEREGREKQVGHSFLLRSGSPVVDPDDFARRLREEILPLLQEYCYDDYSVLASYLGETIVDVESQTVNEAVLFDSDELIGALADHFASADQT
jgi:5-methylcytosine-specific restriction enzyme B